MEQQTQTTQTTDTTATTTVAPTVATANAVAPKTYSKKRLVCTSVGTGLLGTVVGTLGTVMYAGWMEKRANRINGNSLVAPAQPVQPVQQPVQPVQPVQQSVQTTEEA